MTDIKTVGVVGAGLMIAASSAVDAFTQWRGDGPGVGDLIAFPAGAAMLGPAPNVSVRTGDGRSCLIELGVVRQLGGSFAVISRLAAEDDSFVLHWAGIRTSGGARDCGPAADVAVGSMDLQTLAAAAAAQVGGLNFR